MLLHNIDDTLKYVLPQPSSALITVSPPVTTIEVNGEAIFVFDLFPQEFFHGEALSVVHGITIETHQDR